MARNLITCSERMCVLRVMKMVKRLCASGRADRRRIDEAETDDLTGFLDNALIGKHALDQTVPFGKVIEPAGLKYEDFKGFAIYV